MRFFDFFGKKPRQLPRDGGYFELLPLDEEDERTAPQCEYHELPQLPHSEHSVELLPESSSTAEESKVPLLRAECQKQSAESADLDMPAWRRFHGISMALNTLLTHVEQLKNSPHICHSLCMSCFGEKYYAQQRKAELVRIKYLEPLVQELMQAQTAGKALSLLQSMDDELFVIPLQRDKEGDRSATTHLLHYLYDEINHQHPGVRPTADYQPDLL